MRLINADELSKAKFHPLPYTHIVPADLLKGQTEAYERGWNDAIDAIIENAETIDAVEVVRCRDCKWSDTFSDMTAEPHSPLKCLGIRYGGVNEDWFCEHGERKE